VTTRTGASLPGITRGRATRFLRHRESQKRSITFQSQCSWLAGTVQSFCRSFLNLPLACCNLFIICPAVRTLRPAIALIQVKKSVVIICQSLEQHLPQCPFRRAPTTICRLTPATLAEMGRCVKKLIRMPRCPGGLQPPYTLDAGLKNPPWRRLDEKEILHRVPNAYPQ
jgi:hypothetical protein